MKRSRSSRDPKDKRHHQRSRDRVDERRKRGHGYENSQDRFSRENDVKGRKSLSKEVIKKKRRIDRGEYLDKRREYPRKSHDVQKEGVYKRIKVFNAGAKTDSRK